RSDGAVAFPRGFFTPKVGPHSSYGFAPGKIFGQPAALRWGEVQTGSPAIDYVLAESTAGKRIFIGLLNDSAHPVTSRVRAEAAALSGGRAPAWALITSRDAAGERVPALMRDGAVAVG